MTMRKNRDRAIEGILMEFLVHLNDTVQVFEMLPVMSPENGFTSLERLARNLQAITMGAGLFDLPAIRLLAGDLARDLLDNIKRRRLPGVEQAEVWRRVVQGITLAVATPDMDERRVASLVAEIHACHATR